MQKIRSISVIGALIKKERENKGMSQQALGEKIGYGRDQIRKWEQGKLSPSMYDLVKMCEIFDCDYGYLVGDYDLRTREATDVHEVTLLSEKAIIELLEMKKSPEILFFVENLLTVSHEKLQKLSNAYFAYTCVRNAIQPSIEKNKSQLESVNLNIQMEVNGEIFPAVQAQDRKEYLLFELWRRFAEIVEK